MYLHFLQNAKNIIFLSIPLHFDKDHFRNLRRKEYSERIFDNNQKYAQLSNVQLSFENNAPHREIRELQKKRGLPFS